MRKRSTIAIALVSIFALSLGCSGHGHRRITLELPAGQTIVISDEVLLDEDGKRDYSMTFQPAILDWILGQRLETEDEPAELPVTVTTTDGGG